MRSTQYANLKAGLGCSAAFFIMHPQGVVQNEPYIADYTWHAWLGPIFYYVAREIPTGLLRSRKGKQS